jgi:hypothetical protein
MRVNTIKLREIIEEEIKLYLMELNPWHSKKTGRLSGPSAGNVYSLSKPAVDKAGWDKSKAQKGIATRKGNIRGKYGMPDYCGRKKLSGDKINPEKSCSKYPKAYKEGELVNLDIDEAGFVRLEPETQISVQDLMDILDEVFIDSIDEATRMDRKELGKMCKKIGMISMADAQARVLKGVNQAVLASDGKLYGDGK